MIPGKWITGSNGASRLVMLSDELDKKSIENASKVLNRKFSQYEPWMSGVPNLETLFNRIGPRCIEKFSVITDTEELRKLSDAFDDGEFVFGRISIFEKDGLFVETGENEDLSRFKSEIEKSLKWIFRVSPSLTARWKCLVKSVIPLGCVGKKSKLGRGLSAHFYRKAIFTQLPENSESSDLQLALNLVHELGHQALITYQNADLIVENNREVKVFSVIRNVERPIIRSFHAFVVTAYMLELLLEVVSGDANFCRQDLVSFEISERRRLLLMASKELRGAKVEYTQLGREIIDEIELLACSGWI